LHALYSIEKELTKKHEIVGSPLWQDILKHLPKEFKLGALRQMLKSKNITNVTQLKMLQEALGDRIEKDARGNMDVHDFIDEIIRQGGDEYENNDKVRIARGRYHLEIY
jgi:hypothetical protein